VRDSQYRVKATFHHPLLLAEYLVCMLPLLFYRFGRARVLERAALAVLLAMIVWVIFKAQSRSAIVTALLVTLAFAGVFLARSFARKRLDARTVLSLLAIPLLLVFLAAAYAYVFELAVGRSRAEYASSIARLAMLAQGIPLLLAKPVFGYGIGNGPLTLGFLSERGKITLDNYYLSLTLDSGIPALVLLLALMVWAVNRGLRSVFAKDRGNAYMGAALSISVLAFAVMKSILATEHNFPLFFILLGALLVLRSQAATLEPASAHGTSALARGS